MVADETERKKKGRSINLLAPTHFSNSQVNLNLGGVFDLLNVMCLTSLSVVAIRTRIVDIPSCCGRKVVPETRVSGDVHTGVLGPVRRGSRVSTRLRNECWVLGRVKWSSSSQEYTKNILAAGEQPTSTRGFLVQSEGRTECPRDSVMGARS